MPSQKTPLMPQAVADELSVRLCSARRATQAGGRYLSQQGAADAIGCTKRTIYAIERGKVGSVALGTVLAYCSLVGFDPAGLPTFDLPSATDATPAT